MIGAVAIAGAVAFNINAGLKSGKLSDIALANIEALARGEAGWNDTGKGTLYGNSAGTLFCCCDGNNDCGASPCSGCP